ncbi:a-factor receptor [Serendipita sp. 396]|nr:a-factor receptor [Serendipita sp. 396]KAG8781290.1 a-factor receptor [Serendipita sp. 397]KAG8797640.1 a-factor receptor [Serendipita sp. 398]KAG8829412.1 a-factor receptor [Serendipita sp. 400]KAG8863395.1 a-factor receptor [Serendipita sp. 405]
MGIEHPPASPGLSGLFPGAPILCFLSFLCCMLLLPGFIKTRVFTLIFSVVWIGFGCLIIGVNMCIWRNNTRDAPIYADIVARVIHVYQLVLYLCALCFVKFTWNITRPASSLKVIDQRKRYNKIDAFICIGIPLLWFPFLIIASSGRYIIAEDIGPLPAEQPSLGAFLSRTVPMAVTTVASMYFSVLTCVNLWHTRQFRSQGDSTGMETPRQPLYRPLSTLQIWRYAGISLLNMTGMTFGSLWALLPPIIYRNEIVDDKGRPWYTSFDIRNNLKQLSLTSITHREEIDKWDNLVGFIISVPVNGILFFLMFGLGSDTIGIYRIYLDSLRPKGIQKYIPRIPWPSRRPSDLENFITFQPDDIVLEPLPPPVQTAGKFHLAARREPIPLPLAIPPPSPISPHHARPITSKILPISPLERARTFHKEPIPVRLLPINRSSSHGSPVDALSSVDSPSHVSFGRHSPMDLSRQLGGQDTRLQRPKG